MKSEHGKHVPKIEREQTIADCQNTVTTTLTHITAGMMDAVAISLNSGANESVLTVEELNAALKTSKKETTGPNSYINFVDTHTHTLKLSPANTDCG